jgi:phage terminase large subunit
MVDTPRKPGVGLCGFCYEHSVILERPEGLPFAWYTPQPHQIPYHECDTPNLLALGTRDTGKSYMMRHDAIIRCLKFPGFKALILRRTMPDLQKSHLRHIDTEMKLLGKEVGYYREGTHDVKFGNGSFIQFSQCEQMKDVSNYLSSEWDLIIFDELSTFTLEMFLMICAACRSPEDAPYRALVRAGSNTLGIGAKWMKSWFIDHDVDPVDYEDYDPTDFEMQFSTLDQNLYANKADYEKRLKVLPPHVKRAWLRGEFVVEGAYFSNFKYLDDQELPWHVIDTLPTWKDSHGTHVHFLDLPWISIYRAIDWGYSPDPAVCLWIAVLPDGHEVVFKERQWKRTLAKDVAKAIVVESEGMHVVDTFADPSMFAKDGNSDYSIAETFEMHGVPMVAAQNDRALFGYVICEHLDTTQTVEYRGKERKRPKMQILEDDGRGLGCPNLLRTIPVMVVDPNDPKKIAAGEDHWVVALAYFGMGRATPVQDPKRPSVPYWMQKSSRRRFRAVVG